MKSLALGAAFSLLLTNQLAFAADHFCDLTLTGAVNNKVHLTNKMPTVSSDFWLSSSGKAKANQTIDKAFEKGTGYKSSTPAKSDTAVGPLILGCSNDDRSYSINIYTTQTTGDTQVVYGPKNYTLNGSDAKKGELFILGPKLDNERYQLSAPGKLNIEKFDETGIKGTFTLTAQKRKSNETVNISGSFDFACNGDVCKNK